MSKNEIMDIILDAASKAERMAKVLLTTVDENAGGEATKEEKEQLVSVGGVAVDILHIIDRELTDLYNEMERETREHE